MYLRPTPAGPIPRVLSVCVPLSPSPLWCERNRSVAVCENLSKVTPQSIHVVSVAGPSADPCLWDRFETPRMPSTDLKIRIGILAARAPVHGGQYWFAHTTSRLKKATHAGPVVPSIPLPTNRPHFFRNLTIIGGIQQHIHTSPIDDQSPLISQRDQKHNDNNREQSTWRAGCWVVQEEKRRREINHWWLFCVVWLRLRCSLFFFCVCDCPCRSIIPLLPTLRPSLDDCICHRRHPVAAAVRPIIRRIQDSTTTTTTTIPAAATTCRLIRSNRRRMDTTTIGHRRRIDRDMPQQPRTHPTTTIGAATTIPIPPMDHQHPFRLPPQRPAAVALTVLPPPQRHRRDRLLRRWYRPR